MPNLMDLRGAEFNCVKHYFPSGVRVLEIGGGDGFQASLIADLGTHVESIDVAGQPEGSQSHFPVNLYDGRTLSFQNHVFDVGFSSNVLEHIHDLEVTLAESRREIKDDGAAIHILPTPAWRLWTSLTHYIYILMRVTGIRQTDTTKSPVIQPASQRQTVGAWNRAKRVLRAGPHGEYPSAFSELWYFSQKRWADVLRRNGFQVIAMAPSNIFYTGYGVFPWMPISARRILARMLGPATRIFVLRKAP